MNTEQLKCFCGDAFSRNFKRSAEDLERYKDNAVRRSCYGDVKYQDKNDKKNKEPFYCVLHYPADDKLKEFEQAFEISFIKQKTGGRRLNFRGWWFPKGSSKFLKKHFRRKFFDKPTSFRYAVFNTAVDFNKSVFEDKVSFWGAEFREDADFRNCEFKGEAVFTETVFSKKADFWRSKFEGEAFFYKTDFLLQSDFSDAVFSNYVIFRGELDESKAPKLWTIDFEDARFEKPEQTVFHSIQLHPSYFLSHQPRKFVFTDINWGNKDSSREIIDNDENILKKLKNPPPNKHRLLKITYFQLAANAEENSRYDEASKFRRLGLETEWRENKQASWKDFHFLHFIYRMTSYYGESWKWAALILAIILTVSALLYTQVNFIVCQTKIVDKTKTEECKEDSLGIVEAIKHSFATATLQKPELRKPSSPSAEWVVTAETILAPIQFALLALAIRRKFMR